MRPLAHGRTMLLPSGSVRNMKHHVGQVMYVIGLQWKMDVLHIVRQYICVDIRDWYTDVESLRCNVLDTSLRKVKSTSGT